MALRIRLHVLAAAFVLVAVCALVLEAGLAAPVSAPVVQRREAEDGAALLYSLAGPVPGGEPFTLVSRVRVNAPGQGASPFGSTNDEIWLAGVAVDSGAKPTDLALVWRVHMAGWAPAWRLELRSDAGWLLQEPADSLLLPASLRPEWGAVYVTEFSYDPGAGLLAVRLSEEATGRALYQGAFTVKPYAGELHPGAGGKGGPGKEPIAEALGIETLPAFVPVGARARVFSLHESGAYVESAAVDRRAPVRIDLSLPPRALQGTLRLATGDGASRTLLAELEGVNGDRSVAIEGARLPAGDLELVLEYEVDGLRRELGRQRLRVGRASVTIENVALGRDSEGFGVITGEARIDADGPLPPFELAVAYEAALPGEAVPLHARWSRQSGSARFLVDAGGGPVTVPFSFRLDGLSLNVASPEDQGSGGELFVTLNAFADLPGHLHATAMSRNVLGGKRSFPRVGPYVALRGDFHVHTTLSHDGRLAPADRAWESYMYGYDVLAFTDHGNTQAYDIAEQTARDTGLILIRGLETGMVGPSGGEHFTVFGVDGDYIPREAHRLATSPAPGRVFYRDELERIVRHGGFVTYAHPGYPVPELESATVRWMVENGYLHGVEVRGSNPRSDWAYGWALENGLVLIEGSDIHEGRNFDTAARAPVTLLLAREPTAEGVLEALRTGRTLVVREGEMRGKGEWLTRYVDGILDFELVTDGEGACLQISQRGLVPLRGIAQGGPAGNYRFTLGPAGSVCIPWNGEAGELRILWANVWSGPAELLQTVHQLVGGLSGE